MGKTQVSEGREVYGFGKTKQKIKKTWMYKLKTEYKENRGGKGMKGTLGTAETH